MDGEPLALGVPRQLIKSTEWTGWPYENDEGDGDIRLIDLGEAFTRDNVPEKLAQPPGLQAPETIFTDEFDYRLDLWRAGLIVRSPPTKFLPKKSNICFRSIMLHSDHCHFPGSEQIPWLHR